MSQSEDTPSRAIDRTHWDPGPWDQEPDRVSWETEAGYAGLILRNQLGALCGYVGLPRANKFHGARMSDLEDKLDVHGGITWAASAEDNPILGSPELWWVGFDCCHYRDYYPGEAFVRKTFPGVRAFQTHLHNHEGYKDLVYVRGEVESLARQLKELDAK